MSNLMINSVRDHYLVWLLTLAVLDCVLWTIIIRDMAYKMRAK